MIRDKNKVYGEMNDPNTVLALNELIQDQPIIGAGGRYIKNYDVGPNKILITDTRGKLTSISYDVPNKCLGTDSLGFIVMRDIPTNGTNMRLGSEQSPITRFSTNNQSIVHALGIDEGCATIALTKLVDGSTKDIFTFEFETPISLAQETRCAVSINIALNGILLNQLKLVTTANEEIVLNPNNSAVNKYITLPAGVYNKITVSEEQISERYENKAMTLSCLINY